MAITHMAAKALASKLPKVINPTTHAIIDYAMAGGFFVLGAFFWRKNKRAAIGAMVCGGATLTTSMLTDYPGGIKKAISFETHGKIDAGMAGLTATMPTFLAFGDEEEAQYFRGAALVETIVTGLTDFGGPDGKILEMPRRDLA